MRWVGGLWVVAMLLLGCARVRADEPTGELPGNASSMAPAPLSPRAVAEAAQREGGADADDELWQQQQRRGGNLIAAGTALGLSGLAHIAALSASGLHRCENDVTVTGSMIAAGAVTALGAVLAGIGATEYRGARARRADRPKRRNQAALPIALATFVGAQAALWGVWFAGVAGNGNCYLF